MYELLLRYIVPVGKWSGFILLYTLVGFLAASSALLRHSQYR